MTNQASRMTAFALASDDALRLMSMSRDWLGVLDQQRRVLWANPAWIGGLGLTDEQVIGQRFDDLVYPDEQSALAPYFQATDTHPCEFDLPLRNQDHEPIYIRWKVMTHPAGYLLNGQPTAASPPPHALESPFRIAFEHTPIGIAHVDMHGHFQRVNRKFCELLGYTHLELLHRTFEHVTRPEDFPIFEGIMQKLLLGTHDHWELDCIHICKDGTPIWGHMHGRLVRDEFGQPDYFMVTLENIEARRDAEAALRESQFRYRLVADYTYDWEYWRRPDKTFEYVSPSVERITGYTPAEFMADPLLLEKIILPNDIDQFEDPALTDSLRAHEFRVRHKNGQIRWVEHICVPIYRDDQFLGRRASNRDITERKQAQVEIENQQHLLNSIFRAAPDYIYVMDLVSGYQVMSNRAAVGPLAATQQRISLQAALSIMHPDDAARWQAHYADQPNDDIYVFEFRISNGAGAWRWIRAREVVFTRQANGTVHQILGIAHDATAEHEQEAALRESELRFRQMFERHQAIKLLIDPNTGAIIDANPAAAKFYGWDVATLRAMHIQDINTLSDAEVRAEMQRAAAEQRDFFNFHHRRAGGDIRDVEVHSAPVEVSGKTLLYSIISDVTDLHQTQRALLESEIRFDAFMRNIPMVAYIKDPNGRLLYFNPICARVFGLDNLDWPGQVNIPLWDTDPHTQETSFWETNPVMLNEKTTHVDGEERVWLTQTFPISDQEGQILVGGMGVDITSLKHAERQLLALALERERTQILSLFIEKASHEFRTPLSIIELGLYFLRRTVSDDRSRTQLDRMEEQVFHIVALVESMVMMTQLDSMTSLEQQAIAIPGLLQSVGQKFGEKYPQRAVHFQLPPLENALQIQGDPDLLERALVELMSNAHHFSPNSDPIVVEVTEQQGQVFIAVQDKGMGIAPEHHTQIFECFFRADAAHTTRGFGLGLPIVKRILELHHGSIELTSTVGTGSVFRICLPRLS